MASTQRGSRRGRFVVSLLAVFAFIAFTAVPAHASTPDIELAGQPACVDGQIEVPLLLSVSRTNGGGWEWFYTLTAETTGAPESLSTPIPSSWFNAQQFVDVPYTYVGTPPFASVTFVATVTGVPNNGPNQVFQATLTVPIPAEVLDACTGPSNTPEADLLVSGQILGGAVAGASASRSAFIQVEGCTPGPAVVFIDGTEVGTVTPDADGFASGSVPVPSNLPGELLSVDCGDGAATSVVTTPAEPTAAVLGISQTRGDSGSGAGSGTLPRTGSNSVDLLRLALMLLAGGGLILFGSQRLRDRRAVDNR